MEVTDLNVFTSAPLNLKVFELEIYVPKSVSGKTFSTGPIIDVPEPTVLKKLLSSQFVNQTALAKLPKEQSCKTVTVKVTTSAH